MASSIGESPLARFLIYSAAFVVVVAGMKAAESLLVPFLLSVFIAVICSPPIHWLLRRGVPSMLAILLIIALVVVFGMGIGMLVGSSINAFTQDLPEYQAKLQTLNLDFQQWLAGMGVNLSNTQLRESFNPGTALRMAGTTLASLGNVMTNAFLILLTVIFILLEETVFYKKLRTANRKTESGEIGSTAAIDRFTDSVNRYMAIKTLLSLATGVIIAFWLWLIGVDYPVLWGLLAFLLNFVPTLGSILAAIPAVLLALIQLGVGDALLAAAGFVAVNVLIGNLLEPRYMGKGLDLSSLVVLLSLVFWGWVLGPIGMLLSVPLTMTLKIALESFDDTRGFGVMLGSDVVSDEAQPDAAQSGD